MTIYPAIYEMEQIGHSLEFEAVAVHLYCSPTCRMQHVLGDEENLKFSESPLTLDGLVCESCGKGLD